MKIKFLVFLTIGFVIIFNSRGEILIKNHDAVVWGTNHVIQGRTDTLVHLNGVLKVNDRFYDFSFNPVDSSFSVEVNLVDKENEIFAEAGGQTSNSIHLTLGYEIQPEIFAFATVKGRTVDLHAQIISNPDSALINYYWQADADNPQTITISGQTDSVATCAIPIDAISGEYYFDVVATTNFSDTISARTFVTIDSTGIKPFIIQTDYAAWIDSAIIYQITPYNFVSNGDYKAIRDKISELADMGINTIYIQPVYKTYYGGQGYDITNYFSLRPDYGSEKELIELIQLAKSRDMHVIFDFVANHSSIKHPYAQHSIDYGKQSHYYNFYQRVVDSAPYSMHYTHYNGFINYFWDELPNLNYNNPEVQTWISQACKFWVEEYDIDGYRFDAVWGVNARRPEFAKKLRLQLKRIKPEILMLAEDKATWPQTFDERFDAAYDWMPEEAWVSHWSWQYDYNPSANPTIFNFSDPAKRGGMLKNALTNYGNGFHERAKILRFMENNDTQRFISHHGLSRTKMVAGLLFTLDGIPMMYQGQEIGFKTHPYHTSSVFLRNNSIESQDSNGLVPYYRRLMHIRQSYPCLISKNRTGLESSPAGYTYAYRRWQEKENIFVLMNLSSSETTASISIPFRDLDLDTLQTYYLTDLIDGKYVSGALYELEEVAFDMNAFSCRILYLSTDPLDISNVDSGNQSVPEEFNLAQNYPNPFNPSTTIQYYIPDKGPVEFSVYDILGRQVINIPENIQTQGMHQIKFDASNLASGVYIYSLRFKKQIKVNKMVVVK